MVERVEDVPSDAWATIVRSVPIVSVDLVVLVDGGIVLGRRTNEPARGEWFVPGGRVHKGERLEEAVRRVALTELGIDVDVEAYLGVYEHLYEASDVPGSGGKHYVAHGYVVRAETEALHDADGQHSDVRVFAEVPDGLHEYVVDYLEDANVEDRLGR